MRKRVDVRKYTEKEKVSPCVCEIERHTHTQREREHHQPSTASSSFFSSSSVFFFLLSSRPAPFPVQIGQMTLLPLPPSPPSSPLISHPGTLLPLPPSLPPSRAVVTHQAREPKEKEKKGLFLIPPFLLVSGNGHLLPSILSRVPLLFFLPPSYSSPGGELKHTSKRAVGGGSKEKIKTFCPNILSPYALVPTY